MSDIGAAAITGGASLLGGMISNSSNAKTAHKQMEFQMNMARDARGFESHEADKLRSFQLNMSNTAHRREMDDLHHAGLNPILTATGGAGAITAAGAKGSAAPGGGGAGFQAVDSVGNAVSSAMAGRRNQAEVEQIEADERLKDAQRGLVNLDANLRTVDYQKRDQELQTERARTDAERAQASILESTAKGAKLEGEIDETRYGAFMRYIDRAVKSATGGASAFRNVQPR